MRPAPLTRILIRVFANSFYRAHSGLLLFLFSSTAIYYLFINVLNQTHLTPEERIRFNLSLVLAFVSNPAVMALVFLAWLVYTVKSWQYVGEQLLLADQQFLFYSSTSLSRVRQFRSWFTVQLIILLPILGYGVFSLIIGVAYGHYLTPVIILLYILLLITGSAFSNVRRMNQLAEPWNSLLLLNLLRRWPKPFHSLFLYHILDRLKLSLVLTKLFSWLSIIAILHFFSDVTLEVRVAGMVLLAVAAAHAVLVFQEHSFRETRMGFARNFPYGRARLFSGIILVYTLLLLPESIWLVTRFHWPDALILASFGISAVLLFRSLLFCIGRDMRRYLRWTGILLFAFYLFILYGFLWLLVPVNLIASYVLFHTHYYQDWGTD